MAKDYSHIGLDSSLRSINKLSSGQPRFRSAFGFDSENERGVINTVHIQDASINNAKIGTAAIGTANIGTLSFNEISGGTARLGGTVNGDGVLEINVENGDRYFLADKGSVVFFGDSSLTRAEVQFTPGENFLYSRILQVGGNFGGTPSQDGGLTLNASDDTSRVSLTIEGMEIERGGNIKIGGVSAPSAGSASTVTLYVDNSGGKDRLMALFETGAAQVVATEP